MSFRMLKWLLTFGLAAVGALAQAQTEEVPPEVARLVEKFNEDEIPFNDSLLVLGKPEAPVSVVFMLGLSGHSSYLVSRGLDDLIEKYVDTGKVKLIIIDTLPQLEGGLIRQEDYYITSGQLDRWVYTPPECVTKVIETLF